MTPMMQVAAAVGGLAPAVDELSSAWTSPSDGDESDSTERLHLAVTKDKPMSDYVEELLWSALVSY